MASDLCRILLTLSKTSSANCLKVTISSVLVDVCPWCCVVYIVCESPIIESLTSFLIAFIQFNLKSQWQVKWHHYTIQSYSSIIMTKYHVNNNHSVSAYSVTNCFACKHLTCKFVAVASPSYYRIYEVWIQQYWCVKSLPLIVWHPFYSTCRSSPFTNTDIDSESKLAKDSRWSGSHQQRAQGPSFFRLKSWQNYRQGEETNESSDLVQMNFECQKQQAYFVRLTFFKAYMYMIVFLYPVLVVVCFFGLLYININIMSCFGISLPI
jgi:hypothetical protein